MVKKENLVVVPDEVVMNKIYFIRNQKVMLDRDLAELYQVETTMGETTYFNILFLWYFERCWSDPRFECRLLDHKNLGT